jgi:predicted enzyme related to lactoylglutathione lyase
MSSTLTAGAVVYAKDILRLSAFYADVAGLRVTHADADHVVLESQGFQLVVHAVPADIAASFTIAAPPLPREDAAVKLVFMVPSIGTSRTVATKLGGGLDPAAREWRFQDSLVCDGHDPEGNVFQLREQAV